MLSRRNGLHNSRHHHPRMHRRPQLRQRSPAFQHNNHPAHPRNRALPLNSRLPACRQAHRECHRRVRLALLLRDQLFREQLSLRH